MKKRVVSLSMSLLMLFTLLGSVTALADVPDEPHDTNPVPSPRWTYFTVTGVSCIPNGGGSVSFSGVAQGNNLATYESSVYLMNASGQIVGGPYRNGPNVGTVSSGNTIRVSSAGYYYTLAYFYAYRGGKIVESTSLTSGSKWVS